LQVSGLTEKKATSIFASAQALLQGGESNLTTAPVEPENQEAGPGVAGVDIDQA
jgi:hypothetical protein